MDLYANKIKVQLLAVILHTIHYAMVTLLRLLLMFSEIIRSPIFGLLRALYCCDYLDSYKDEFDFLLASPLLFSLSADSLSRVFPEKATHSYPIFGYVI